MKVFKGLGRFRDDYYITSESIQDVIKCSFKRTSLASYVNSSVSDLNGTLNIEVIVIVKETSKILKWYSRINDIVSQNLTLLIGQNNSDISYVIRGEDV
ncbi:MAG: hypothetical protein K4H23_00995 [Mollicutes bacterium PWAP]|nr:hypothetical protein [Mollicutes bacterium PWAP]